MAVVMTTKFYEETTPAWHDLSKIVFTSPNMDSPNTAGTRSHILPGQGNLALWYEDSANMYEIEPIQDTYDTSFYYYHFAAVNNINLDNNPTAATITVGNYPQFINFIKETLEVEVIGFTDMNSDVSDETLKLEYIVRITEGYPLENIYLNNVIRTYNSAYSWVDDKSGWQVEIIDDILECYIDFEFIQPTNITYIKIEPRYREERGANGASTFYWYFIGNFKIQGKTNIPEASWVDLYEGANTVFEAKDIFMTNNTVYYTYYRILILNNDSFDDFESTVYNRWQEDYYAISGLLFYGYEYSTDPGTGQVILYSFDEDTSSRELHVVNAVPVEGSPVNNIYNNTTSVEGVINVSSFLNGDVLTTCYKPAVNEVGMSSDYNTQASGNSVVPVISGTTGLVGTEGSTSIFQDYATLVNGYMDVVGETKIEGNFIYSSLSGQQTNITYSDNTHNITTDITYTTTVSGAITDGYLGDVPVTGYTNRYEDKTSTLRSAFYNIAITDTVGSGTIGADTVLYLWHQDFNLLGVEFSTHDSVVFEITQGEAYNCRLTAWDDVTHSTTLNYLLMGNYVRVSALAFRSEGTILIPEAPFTLSNYIASPVYNRIFKGNTVYEGVNYYYGDFNLGARTEPNMIGDYLIFKPMLYNIDNTIPYGIHDHVITLMYSYT